MQRSSSMQLEGQAARGMAQDRCSLSACQGREPVSEGMTKDVTPRPPPASTPLPHPRHSDKIWAARVFGPPNSPSTLAPLISGTFPNKRTLRTPLKGCVLSCPVYGWAMSVYTPYMSRVFLLLTGLRLRLTDWRGWVQTASPPFLRCQPISVTSCHIALSLLTGARRRDGTDCNQAPAAQV